MNVAENALHGAAGIRKRRDLIAQPVRFQRQSFWSIKDPLTLRYYQLRDEEYFVLSQFDGATSLEQICARFHERFAPHRIDRTQLGWFMGTLHRESLITTDAANQGQRLWERGQREGRQRVRGRFANLLAIRFRGINPTALLDFLYPLLHWLFSPLSVLLGMVSILGALVWAVLHLDRVINRLPQLSTFLTVDYLLWIPVALAAAKIIHELSHALVCKHFGGTCREMGVMLLVFTPCLYCNVSDAWLIPAKWKRIAISGAGMFAELVLASIAFFLWYLSVPGILNSICLSLCVVCSLGTLLFNGNPLLRYDGYFMLADWLEIPNLSEQATAIWRQRIAKWLFGFELPTSPLASTSGRQLIAAYGIAATCYRWMLIVGILLGLRHFLAAYRLEWVALVLAILVIAGMAAEPINAMTRLLRDPHRRRQVRTGRASCFLLVAALVISLISWIPVPSRVTAPAVVQPVSAGSVYVSVPGRLTWAITEGQRVAAGEVVARLDSPELTAQLLDLQGVCRLHALEVEQLAKRAVHISGFEATARIPAARDALADYQRRLAQLQKDAEALALRAPRDGVVMAANLPPTRRNDDHDEVGTFASWTCSPLDQRNIGCYLERETEFCTVGDADQIEAVLIIPEFEIGDVRAGQRVHLRFPSAPWHDLTGTVAQVSPAAVQEIPFQLVTARLVATDRDAISDERFRPVVPSYQVRVGLDQGSARTPAYATGQARIAVAPRSLASRLQRYWARTFR